MCGPLHKWPINGCFKGTAQLKIPGPPLHSPRRSDELVNLCEIIATDGASLGALPLIILTDSHITVEIKISTEDQRATNTHKVQESILTVL